MALALALTFILVLCCQSASASSIRQSISNGQHKSSQEDHNPLSRNRRETKGTIVELYGYGKSCNTTSDCSWLWSGLVCESKRCVCPVFKRPEYLTETCVYEDKNEGPLTNFGIEIIIVISFILFVAFGCLVIRCIRSRLRERERESSPTNELPPVGVSALTNTSSALNLLDVRTDSPPDYTDVHMQAPQEKANERDNNLPTYDEVEKQPEWNSQPVFDITPHSSGEEPGPHGSFGATRAFAPSASAKSPPWEERDSSLTLRTDDHQSQNHGYHVDSSESDGHTNYDYHSFDCSNSDGHTNHDYHSCDSSASDGHTNHDYHSCD